MTTFGKLLIIVNMLMIAGWGLLQGRVAKRRPELQKQIVDLREEAKPLRLKEADLRREVALLQMDLPQPLSETVNHDSRARQSKMTWTSLHVPLKESLGIDQARLEVVKKTVTDFSSAVESKKKLEQTLIARKEGLQSQIKTRQEIITDLETKLDDATKEYQKYDAEVKNLYQQIISKDKSDNPPAPEPTEPGVSS